MPDLVLDTGMSGVYTPPTSTATPAPAVPPTGDNSSSSSSWTPGPIPNIDIYANAEIMANNAYNKALAQLNSNRLNTLTQYGYAGDVDPKTGVVKNVRVDPHSLYGQLQQLLHGQAVEDKNAEFAAQDRGLIGGLANQAGSELRYAHGGQDTALGLDLTGKMSDFQGQQQAAAEVRDNTLWQAQQAQLQAELQAEYNQEIAALIASLTGGGGGDKSGAMTTTTSGAGQPSGYRDNNPGGVQWTAPISTATRKPVYGRI